VKIGVPVSHWDPVPSARDRTCTRSVREVTGCLEVTTWPAECNAVHDSLRDDGTVTAAQQDAVSSAKKNTNISAACGTADAIQIVINGDEHLFN